MVLKYESGVEVRKGGRVLFHGEPGEIEMVASGLEDLETGWYVGTAWASWWFSQRFLGGGLFPQTTLRKLKIWSSSPEPADSSEMWLRTSSGPLSQAGPTLSAGLF